MSKQVAKKAKKKDNKTAHKAVKPAAKQHKAPAAVNTAKPVAEAFEAPVEAPEFTTGSMFDSKVVVWSAVVLAILLLCATATVAFGMHRSRSDENALKHIAPLSAQDQPTLKVIGTDDDLLGKDGSVPSTGAAAALQTQNTANTPQSPVSADAATAANALHAGAVTLQAGVGSNVNGLSVNEPGL
ncbi:MAG TPA: hypothetical protein VLH86_05065 [Patescibacteria group bacterium]|nr:hypothetical protein [Patescibacteria group bacterium]